MDSGELKRIKEVINKADHLTNEIARLREAVETGRKIPAVKFCFKPFEIQYEDDGRLRTACSAHLLQDLADKFRAAFLAIVEQRLAEREQQLEDLTC